MITITIVAIYLLTFYSVGTKNPVKLRFILVLLRAMVFLIMNLGTGTRWFPIIFILLFTGGILIIFMILSSILPNEKPGKIWKPTRIIFTVTILICFLGKTSQENLIHNSVKAFISRGSVYWILISLLLLYFFSVILIVKRKKLPMRTLSC